MGYRARTPALSEDMLKDGLWSEITCVSPPNPTRILERDSELCCVNTTVFVLFTQLYFIHHHFGVYRGESESSERISKSMLSENRRLHIHRSCVDVIVSNVNPKDAWCEQPRLDESGMLRVSNWLWL